MNRGTCTFSDKIRNIQAGGALIGVIGLVDGTCAVRRARSRMACPSLFRAT